MEPILRSQGKTFESSTATYLLLIALLQNFKKKRFEPSAETVPIHI